MNFASNILALIMVLGLCWLAMMWMSGRFHGHGQVVEIDDFEFDEFETSSPAGVPCSMCEGVGASQSRGRLQPCPLCEGTGVAV